MAVALTVNKKTKLGAKGFIIKGTVVFSANYAAGGEALDLRSVGLLNNGVDPDFVDVNGIAGFVYSYNVATRKLMIFCNTAGGANSALGEHIAAAVVAGVTGDTITLTAIYL